MKLLQALVVDRSSDRKDIWIPALEGLGFECLEAANGIEALRLASEHGIDLLVLDLETALIGGADLVHLIQCGLFGTAPPPTVVYVDKHQLASWKFAGPPFVFLVESPTSPEVVSEVVDRAFGWVEHLETPLRQRHS